MFRLLRVIVRTVLAAIWTGGLFAVIVLCMALGAVFNGALRKSPSEDTIQRFGFRARQVIVRLWGRGIARVIGMRILVRGTPPARPFFLVANHVSHVDAYLMLAVLGCLFVGKSEVASWPVIGLITRTVGMIFVNREKRSDALPVNERIARALARGDGVTMFAESTTSRGLEIQPFKTALLEPAIQCHMPVHYATIHYAAPDGQPPASQWVCWWDGFPLSFGMHTLGVLSHPGFTATVTFGESPISAPDRKTLAHKLWEAASAQFTPID